MTEEIHGIYQFKAEEKEEQVEEVNLLLDLLGIEDDDVVEEKEFNDNNGIFQYENKRQRHFINYEYKLRDIGNGFPIMVLLGYYNQKSYKKEDIVKDNEEIKKRIDNMKYKDFEDLIKDLNEDVGYNNQISNIIMNSMEYLYSYKYYKESMKIGIYYLEKYKYKGVVRSHIEIVDCLIHSMIKYMGYNMNLNKITIINNDNDNNDKIMDMGLFLINKYFNKEMCKKEIGLLIIKNQYLLLYLQHYINKNKNENNLNEIIMTFLKNSHEYLNLRNKDFYMYYLLSIISYMYGFKEHYHKFDEKYNLLCKEDYKKRLNKIEANTLNTKEIQASNVVDKIIQLLDDIDSIDNINHILLNHS